MIDIAGSRTVDRAGAGGLGRLLDHDIGCAGTSRLAVIIEGALGAPAVHILLKICNGERGGVFTGDGGT